jgi:predicted amino acid-binding ACT domain protein
MALTVQRITLWRSDVDNRPGVLADTLAPLATAGAALRLVMGYRYPQAPERSAIEVFPVSGRRATAAAQAAGLAPSDIPCLLVEGDDRQGLGADMARALASEGINIAFLMAQVVGRRFTAAVGFADEDTARRATPILKRLGAPKRAARKTARARR